jgi:hypothetical protein
VKANQSLKTFADSDNGYTQVVTGILALFIVIIAGVMIFWEISDAFDMPNADANDSKNETTAMFSTIVPLLVIIGLVLVAGVIIGIISRFGG